MKLISRILFLINIFFFLALLILFIFPFLPPSKFPLTAVLSLGTPVIILINICFTIFWLLTLNKRFLLSFFAVVAAFVLFNIFPAISTSKSASDFENGLKVMTYNVRLFNAYEKKKNFPDVKTTMASYIEKEQPDVICFQEFYRKNPVDFKDYPYKFIHFKRKGDQLGNAIYSKYPLRNTGAFDFKNSNNNTLYADVIKGKDTIRVYSLHLQSHGVIPEVQFLQEQNTEKLFRQLHNRFVQQEKQVKAILNHKSKTTYPVLIMGDFNNTPFSYSYKKLKTNMNDAFREAGSGMGSTFSFAGFPMRIDFILASPSLEVTSFETLKGTFSDHRAITAQLSW